VISRRERAEVSRRSVFAETRGILAKYAEEERRRERKREATISLIGYGRARAKPAEAESGLRNAQRYSRGAPERVRVTPACLSLFVLYLARGVTTPSLLITQRVAMRAPRARENAATRARARSLVRIVAQDWRNYRYLAMCLQQQIRMRKLLNVQASKSRLSSNLIELLIPSLDMKIIIMCGIEFLT